MNTTKRCIISWATRGREDYPQGLKKLIPSLLKTNTMEPLGFIIFCPDFEADEFEGVKINRKIPDNFPIPSHQAVPYGFKPWLFRLAFNGGFDQVLWCDSTIVCHKPLDPIWKIMEERGIFAADNPGCPMRVWTADDAMRKMGCPFEKPEDAMFNEIMACALGIDIRHPKSREAFSEWWDLCNDGVTFAGREGSKRPEFRGHRHDQSAMSWLVEKYGIEREAYGRLLYHGTDMQKFPDFILANTGIGQDPYA